VDLGLKGKTVLITAPSQGIGRSIAKLFSKNKAKCILVSRNSSKLKTLKAQLDKNIKGNLIYSCDLKNDNELNGFLSFLNKHKCPDFVIHNIGGTLSQKSPMVEYNKWLDVINFNVGIAIKINNFLIPKMKKKNNHKIVHISSISGISYRGSAPYVCSKTFLNSYIKTLGIYLGKKNIVVSGIMPGAVFSKGGHWDAIKKNKPEIINDFLRHHHGIGRFGYPQEVAIWALYLCSKYTTPFATGAIINIDGGTN
jgi:3-oxoacyl-[acyl-carrier protein] reductase